MTTITLITPSLSGTGNYACGIQWAGADGLTRRAVMDSMGWQNGQVNISWHVENQGTNLIGNTVWESASSIDTPALTVDDQHFRYLADGSLRVANSSEALEEDGSIKAGYISEYMFFFKAFGDKSLPIPVGINYFIQDALLRKLNSANPGLNLVLSA